MSLAPAAADHLASRSRRACSIFVSADDVVPTNANESRAMQPDRTNDFVFMAPSSPESNVASMFFQRRIRKPGNQEQIDFSTRRRPRKVICYSLATAATFKHCAALARQTKIGRA